MWWRLSTGSREREGRRCTCDAQDRIGPVVGRRRRGRWRRWKARGRARPTGRGVRDAIAVGREDARHEVSGAGATCPTISGEVHPALAAHRTARQVEPVSRCISTGTDSGRTSSGGGWPRSARHRARVPRRVRLASRPKWRMRMKPRGTTCRKKRRRNSSTSSVMTFRRSWSA